MPSLQRWLEGNKTRQQTVKYRITLAYDGTDYSGFQFQAGLKTIQGVLNSAVDKLESAPVTLHAAGRTDAGVHAEGQVISFQLNGDWDPSTLVRAINGNLPDDIRVLDAARAPEDFHARFNAKGKTYRYQVWNGEVMNPFLLRHAWHYRYAIDIEKLSEQSRALLGTHDFSAFTVSDCEVRTRIRTITRISIDQQDSLISLVFSGDGFLRYQVRTMVGVLMNANRGRLKISSIEELIESRDRKLAGTPAPAQGLTLMKVEY